MNAYQSIKDSIIKGIYKPGMRLTEENLASEFNLSRTPIREAITRLEAEGLITPLKRGVIVRTFTKEDIKQIYDLRGLLEGYAASQAALNRTDDNLLILETSLHSYHNLCQRRKNGNLNNITETMEVNANFHETILQSSKNEHIKFLISKVVVLPLVFRSFYWYSHEEMFRSYESHQTIFNAIKEKDQERARIAMLEHVYQGRDCALRNLDNIETPI